LCQILHMVTIEIVINSTRIMGIRVTISCRYCIAFEAMLLFLVLNLNVIVLQRPWDCVWVHVVASSYEWRSVIWRRSPWIRRRRQHTACVWDSAVHWRRRLMVSSMQSFMSLVTSRIGHQQVSVTPASLCNLCEFWTLTDLTCLSFFLLLLARFDLFSFFEQTMLHD